MRSQLREKFNLSGIIGESTAFQQVLKSLRKAAATDTTVLLLGESFTGSPQNYPGEKQQVAIGSALLTSPALLLMDEFLAQMVDRMNKGRIVFIGKTTAAMSSN